MNVRTARTSVVCLLAVGLATALPGGATASSTANIRATASAKAGVNDLRVRTGHRALRSSAKLDRFAAAYARTMLRRQYFGHASRLSGASSWHALGEALALQPGRHPRARVAVSLWRHSAPHYAILTSGSFTRIGMGAATGRFHGRRVTMWVARVAR